MALLTDNLVAYWKFDEGSGTSVAESVNGLTGTFDTAGWSGGKIGSASNFTGANNVTVADNAILDFTTNAMAISAWVYPTSASYGGFGGEIVKKDLQYIVRIETNNFNFITWATTNGRKDTAGVYVQNAWNHIVCVYVSFFLRTRPFIS